MASSLLRWDFDPRDAADEYFVWPASEAAVAMEREQWAIYVAYEVSDAGRRCIRRTEGSMPATTN